MNRIVQIKRMMVVLFMVSIVPLCAMELALQQTDTHRCSLNDTWLFVTRMQERGVMTDDVAAVIAHESYLLRMDEINKKFDSFFHFNNESPQVKLNRLRDAYKRVVSMNLNIQEAENFKQCCAAQQCCRRFNYINPHDLAFFTKEHDSILSELLSLGCFAADKGHDVIGESVFTLRHLYSVSENSSLKFNAEQHQLYLILPDEFRQKLRNYKIR